MKPLEQPNRVSRARPWPSALCVLGVCTQVLATTPNIQTASPTVAMPASVPPGQTHLNLPDAPEKRLVEAHCVACHDLRRVENSGATRTGWMRRLERMIRRGSTLPPEDIAPVAAYLARTLPERPRPVPAEPLQSAP